MLLWGYCELSKLRLESSQWFLHLAFVVPWDLCPVCVSWASLALLSSKIKDPTVGVAMQAVNPSTQGRSRKIEGQPGCIGNSSLVQTTECGPVSKKKMQAPNEKWAELCFPFKPTLRGPVPAYHIHIQFTAVVMTAGQLEVGRGK